MSQPPTPTEARTGAELIAAERQRQIAVEGYTPEHDDRHKGGSLARAAFCYSLQPKIRPDDGSPPKAWPWDIQYWKPCPDDPVRELVKAGALYRAEAQRLIRADQLFNEALETALSGMRWCAARIDNYLDAGVSP